MQTFKEPGIHEIILRNEPDPHFNRTSQITLDQFDIEIPGNNSSSPAIITTTVAPSSSPRASSTSMAYSSQKEATPLGAILGGALGGLIILILFSLHMSLLSQTLPEDFLCGITICSTCWKVHPREPPSLPICSTCWKFHPREPPPLPICKSYSKWQPKTRHNFKSTTHCNTTTFCHLWTNYSPQSTTLSPETDSQN